MASVHLTRRRAATMALLVGPVLVWAAGCSSQPKQLTWHEEPGYRWAELSPGSRGHTGFAERSPSRTGLDFDNQLTEQEIAANRHYLNGSGVAAGDVDGDGWTDLYFAGLDGPDKLYRNLGGLRFRDVTDSAGVANEGRFSTSAVFADVDGDGDLDLLVGSIPAGVALYANDGKGMFSRVADAGLRDTSGKGTMTLALADVDGDGDLDLYVTNYRERSIDDSLGVEQIAWDKTVKEKYSPDRDDYTLTPPYDRYYTIVKREGAVPERREVGEPDQLFLNDGAGRFREADGPTHFLDPAGKPMGPPRDWGLGAKFQDLNGDGLPDLYVCNDFWTLDRVWINQGRGVFREIDPTAIRNFSFSAMTVDFSDVDRDGNVDIFTTEMLSPQHERRARHYIPRGPYPRIRYGIDRQPQYNRNSLFVNRGDNTYAETAWYSGVEATGWSWASQFLDVDLDGYEDLLVNNGFAYDLQDLDTQLRVNRSIAQGGRTSVGSLVAYPPLPLVNEALRNNGDLTFSDVSRDWGFTEGDVSQGLALADLDHDGDLDLVINRLNQTAALYENTGTAPRIAVRLIGRPPNTQAVGARIELDGGPVTQKKQVVSGGVYLSGSDPVTVFAADPDNLDHTLKVTWPNGRTSVLDSLGPDRIYEVTEPADTLRDEARGATGPTAPHSPASAASAAARPVSAPATPPVFEDVSDRIGYVHHEDMFHDFDLQPLLPFKVTRQGPGVSWIDYDRDGDPDLFIASGRGGHMGVFRNQGDGTFTSVPLDSVTRWAPGDQTTILGWGDGDGTTLLVGSANIEQGNVGSPSALDYTVRRGRVVAEQDVPRLRSTTGALAAADYDGDGDVDLFVGGRFVPAQWPASATSRLFTNEGGKLVLDRTNSPELADLGLVTGAVFTDYDQDGDPDLLLSLEWGTLELFRNDEGRFHDITDSVGLSAYEGWWNGVATGDFDNDGRPDIVATNLGRNSPYQLTPAHPLRTYYQDFNFDGRMDVIEAYFDPDARAYVPRRQLQDYASTIANTVTRYVRTHEGFATATLEGIFGPEVETMPFREINTLDQTVFLNRGDHFEAHSLPRESQLSIAFAASVGDYDDDGNEDLFLSQNLFSVRPDLPRLDAGRGLWLKGDGKGGFTAIPGQVSGVEVYGEQRGAALADFDGDGKVDLVVTQNAAPVKLYHNRTERAGLRVRLAGPDANRDGIGSSLRVVYSDGAKGPLREIQAGSGYWSQNDATQVLGTTPGKTVARIEVRWSDGTTQAVDVRPGERSYIIRHP